MPSSSPACRALFFFFFFVFLYDFFFRFFTGVVYPENDGNHCLPGDPPLSREPRKPSPRGHLPTPPARRVRRLRPFFRREHRGLLCGAGVAWSRGRGGSGGGRKSRCPAGCTKTEEVLKINDVTTTTTTITTTAVVVVVVLLLLLPLLLLLLLLLPLLLLLLPKRVK